MFVAATTTLIGSGSCIGRSRSTVSKCCPERDGTEYPATERIESDGVSEATIAALIVESTAEGDAVPANTKAFVGASTRINPGNCPSEEAHAYKVPKTVTELEIRRIAPPEPTEYMASPL